MSYGNGIKLTAGFDVGAKTPLDSKSVVQTIAERDAFVTDNLVYEGLEVYVKDTGHKYRYNGTGWKDLDTQSGSESGTGEGLTTEQANQLTTAYEHSQTPHVSADDIPTNISDLTNDSGFITSSDLPTVPTKVSDLENDSNFVTNSKMLEAIANAQLGNGEDSDIDLSIYQPIEESTLTTTAKTIPTAINELKSSLDGITVPTKTSDLENDSGFITSIPSEYITETELETKGYLTEHQSLTDYAKKIDIPDVSDFLTEVPAEYVTDTKLSTELDKKVNNEVGKGLSTNDLTNELVIKINSSATEAFVTNAIANAQLGSGEVDLSGYATIDALKLKADLTHTHDQYLTKVPEEYITETELNAKGYLTEHQNISGLQPKTDDSLTTTDKTVVGAINEVKDMADLILDTEVRIDKTYSSNKIYTDIQQCLEDSKTYTLEEIARASTASYKIVTDVADMTEERYLYLLYDGATNYDIYVVEADGTPTKIGSTQIDLSNYYTKEEVDELLEANAVDLTGYAKTYTSLTELGLTADATFQDAIDALPKGGSAILGVKDFTNYQTIFPYEEGNDQFARVHIIKGIADGSCVYARWFRKDGVKEAIAIFNINDNKFNGWKELATMDKINALREETTGYISGSLLGSVVKDANLYYKKFGDNRLVINGWVSVDAVSTRTPIFTLPNNWKANLTYLLPCYVIDSNVACACLIDVENGTFNSYTPLPATLELRFCGEIYLM